jgi:hypothetical protein
MGHGSGAFVRQRQQAVQCARKMAPQPAPAMPEPSRKPNVHAVLAASSKLASNQSQGIQTQTQHSRSGLVSHRAVGSTRCAPPLAEVAALHEPHASDAGWPQSIGSLAR